jgi:hypothetical protein
MHSRLAIFKDYETQLFFEEKGFVKINFLNYSEVEELSAFYAKNERFHTLTNKLHHTSTDTQNEKLIIEEDQVIKSVFALAIEKTFKNTKALVGCFHIKESGFGSATNIHQDPTFVDDEKYTSANIWVALQDTDTHNGNLFFVAGSNKVSSSLRVTPEYPLYYSTYIDALKSAAIEVPLKAGEAVVFNNATIHGSTENLSGKIRLAATLLICSQEAQWQIYFNNFTRKEKKIEKYQLDFDTFMYMNVHKKLPEIKRVDTFDYNFPVISKELFFLKTKGQRQGFLHWAMHFLNFSKADV